MFAILSGLYSFTEALTLYWKALEFKSLPFSSPISIYMAFSFYQLCMLISLPTQLLEMSFMLTNEKKIELTTPTTTKNRCHIKRHKEKMAKCQQQFHILSHSHFIFFHSLAQFDYQVWNSPLTFLRESNWLLSLLYYVTPYCVYIAKSNFHLIFGVILYRLCACVCAHRFVSFLFIAATHDCIRSTVSQKTIEPLSIQKCQKQPFNIPKWIYCVPSTTFFHHFITFTSKSWYVHFWY